MGRGPGAGFIVTILRGKLESGLGFFASIIEMAW
jgi:hypothetical protein